MASSHAARSPELKAQVGVSDQAITSVARLGGLIFNPDGPRPVLLLGAGASVKSGVPLADDLAALAVRHTYCRERGLAEDDPSIKRSDWFPWLAKEHKWFDPASSLVAQYPRVVERLLQPREDRKQFFLAQIAPRVPRSTGYSALAELIAAGWLRTILTPNFDHLIHDACRAESRIRRIQSIQTPSEADLISTALPYPQIVHLHGSVEHYTDQNLEDETRELDAALRQRLLPLLRDRPLIVLGYRGAEPSIMRDLLIDGAAECRNYRYGIFWCVRGGTSDDMHPLVSELADVIGTNFQFVRIVGFDECIGEWLAQGKGAIHPEAQVREAQVTDVPDLAPEPSVTLDDLDLQLLGRTLAAHAQRVGRQAPSRPDRRWIEGRMSDSELDLSVDLDGKRMLTRAARLLFGRGDEVGVELRVFGEADVQLISGNLLSVLDRTLDTLNDFNQPFTLKGSVSETVRPYPALAFKELVVNALVHRDYDRDEHVSVLVEPRMIRFTSPGGLVEGLDPTRLGEPAQKAYRNPVMADMLYGTGAMDKEGSGLADVRRWTRENGGSVSFAPAPDNESFVALLEARPELPDDETDTAEPANNLESFLTNIVSVRLLRDHVSVAPVKPGIVKRQDVWDLVPGRSVAPFVLHEGVVITFSDLGDDSNPLVSAIEGDPESHDLEDFFAGPDRERLLVQILNSSLIKHARTRGLLNSHKGSLYYTSTPDGAREITYRARARRATRTVAKPIVSRSDPGQIRYWEHEALAFRFRRFGDEWGLVLLPGWLFTRDGKREFLRGPRVTRLATRRSARDFNPQVTNDLVFWVRTLIGDADEVLLDDDTRAIAISGRPVSLEYLPAPAAPGIDDQGDDRDTLDALREELDDVIDEADANEDVGGAEEDGT